MRRLAAVGAISFSPRVDENLKEAIERTRRWMRWLIGILLCAPLLAVGFWFWAMSKAQQDFEAAVLRLAAHRGAEKSLEPEKVSEAERTQLIAVNEEFVKRLSAALQRRYSPGDTATPAYLRTLAEGTQWTLVTQKFSDAQWEEIAQPLEPLLSDVFVGRAHVLFGAKGFFGRSPIGRLALRTLLQREQRRGTFALEHLARDGPARRMLELVRTADVLSQFSELRVQLLNGIERAVAEPKRPLTAEQVEEFWRLTGRLAEAETGKSAAWLKRLEDEILASNEFWRQDSRTSGIILRVPRDPASRTWRGRIQMPWTVANQVRALDKIGLLLSQIEAGQPLSGPTLAKLARDLEVTDARRPGSSMARSLPLGLSQMYSASQFRAKALGWGVALNVAAGRDLAVDRAPEILRWDLCSGLPFRVRRDGKFIVVHGLGFDCDDDGGAPTTFLAPMPGGGAARRKAAFKTRWDLLDGDIEEQVEMPK